MKVALICPSNILYMPYINNYEKILQENFIKYDIINWDRFHIESKFDDFKYRDGKKGHQRNYIDYLKYRNFIINKLNSISYDKIIVFGIQLSYFLYGLLLRKYNNKFIMDIRDYNKIIKYFNIKKLVDNSRFTVISSPGYLEWLPKSDKYIINHNTILNNLNGLQDINDNQSIERINIAYIGSIRDYTINIDLINSIKNKDYINLLFHGEGDINKHIIQYITVNNIANVFFTGRYKKEDESLLYKKSDIINILIPNNHINSKTLLPNRLYNAVIYGKPVITFTGTYLATQVSKFKLGLILTSFDNVEQELRNYLKEFNVCNYIKGRRDFFKDVVDDNQQFMLRVKDFINSEFDKDLANY